MVDSEDRAGLLEAFKAETFQKAIRDTRLSAIVAVVGFALFTILDFFSYRDLYVTLTVIRLVVVVCSFLVYLTMRTSFGQARPYLMAMVEYLLCGVSIVTMVHLTGGYVSAYYAGINLVLLFFIFILPLDARKTAAICSLLYAAYLVPILALQRIDRFDIFANNNFFLFTTILLVILSAHLATQMRFREFSSRYNLAHANEELKKLDILKSQFFANVSHEVRTPLTSIIAPVQSLYQGDLGTMEPEQQRLVGQVYRNSLKLLDMINQMLDFSKFEAGKMDLRLKQVDLDETASDVVSIFQDVAERKGLRLRYAREGEASTVYLDGDKVERVLTNLVRNAIKFTETGSITVRVGSQDGMQWLEVRDTGIGIAAEHLPLIFRRFQQVDTSSTRKYEGTGLGLTIVKESVELMRGTIDVQSKEGLGTTFRVELPGNLEDLVPGAFIDRRRVSERRRVGYDFGGDERRRQPRRESDLAKVAAEELALIDRDLLKLRDKEEPPAGEPAAGGGRVLLVEDNVDLRAYISKMLARFGHTVATSIDGLDGWEHVQSHLPDLVVSDVMMPKMDGFELVRRIKSTDKTRRIPVILVTAKPELESKLEGLGMGADDYLPKPINIRELDARIRNLITTRDFQLALAREAELNAKMEELSMSFSQSLEIRDYNTAGHSRDVLKLGSIIARGLGTPVDRELRDSLLLHDIGKLGIPDRILLKESPLTPEEWQTMRRHPELGAELLGHFESYRQIASIILAHQEHYDGTGYPNALSGEDIPIFARIIAIADAYHAMTSNRPYRKALPAARAVFELTRNRGTQFDARLVDTFVAGLLELRVISDKDLEPSGS